MLSSFYRFEFPRTKYPREDWQVVAARKVADTRSRIPEAWLLNESQLEQARNRRDITGSFIKAFLSETEGTITDLSAPEIADKIRQSVYSAKETTIAFCHRAAVAHQLVNENNAGVSSLVDSN
ncbi:MAG: hypothetical protein Q9160_000633 [Pyrenula sp. 1 TL-2023]